MFVNTIIRFLKLVVWLNKSLSTSPPPPPPHMKARKLYLCRPRKYNCQPFCGPEVRTDCSDSVFSLRPAPLSYLWVRVRILGVLKIVCCCTIKPDCCLCRLWSCFLTDSAACVLSFDHSTPLHSKQGLPRPWLWRQQPICFFFCGAPSCRPHLVSKGQVVHDTVQTKPGHSGCLRL